ncbi:MAG TPA: hypothetical protein V6C82_09510, partial [Chroococcales cyanobacterium]
MTIRRLIPAIDLGLMVVAYIFAFLLRFDGSIHVQHLPQFWQFFMFVPILRISCNFLWGIYRQAWRYVGMREVKNFAFS